MSKGRMEAFSDGVLAIVITIMVLDLSAPRGQTLSALRPLLPVFLGYVLSFVFVGIYWNNHHHLLQAVNRVDGRVLWANLLLLFWLSLIPFANRWMGQSAFAAEPVALYGVILLLAAVAYFLLVQMLIAANGRDSMLARAVGRDIKGKLSIGIYIAAVAVSWLSPITSFGLYVLVAIIWLVPDRRIERMLAGTSAVQRQD